MNIFQATRLKILLPGQARSATLTSSSEAIDPSSLDSASSPLPHSLSTPSTPSTTSSTSSVDLEIWPHSFRIPWERMPLKLRTAIATGRRPTPADRKPMIRITVDEMRLVELNPTRADCHTIAKNIVKQYPKSFADALKDGAIIGSGYASLVNQLKTCIEHLNCDNVLARRRKQKRLSGTQTVCNTRAPSDQYGCARWQPDCPSEETEDRLEEKRKEMEELYSCEGPTGAERGQLSELMQATYYLQRRTINASPAPSIAELKSKWPYLFIQKELYNHFKLLTDILEKVDAAMEEKGKMIVQYFRHKPTN
ncbi:uncharacterized protein LOC135262573 [Anguilla rostrata]|uniref:uncharacterized protein LOC135262573 n=1 Tax=Anguilla rostrata TaxID=7938 RepID=UPI0030CB42AE